MYRVLFRGVEVWCQTFEALMQWIDAAPVPSAPKLIERSKRVVRKKKPEPMAVEPSPRSAGDVTDAERDRQEVLKALGRSEVGLTLPELKRHIPKMEQMRRSNALTTLKAKGLIERRGNTWAKVA